MHYLQKIILDKLRYHQPLSYSALMPDGIESSHFRYHLKQLMTEGLIEKQANDYMLTAQGYTAVDYLSRGRTTPILTPKVITYTLLTHKGALLLYNKDKEPYRGLVGLFGGKVKFGEDFSQAAQRSVTEKTGIAVDLPELRGLANIQIAEDDTLLSHVTAYVHHVDVAELPETLNEQTVLVLPSQVEEQPLIPDLLPLLEALSEERTEPFFISLRLNLTDHQDRSQ